MPTIESRIPHVGGIPLGGLGTGSIEIRPDGSFRDWQIFNLGAWAPYQPEPCARRELFPSHAGLSFYLRAEQSGPPLVRRLSLCPEEQELYSLAWLRSVDTIEFDGRYPVARLRYVDANLPVAVEAIAFSPFTPHDAMTSGTPGCHIVFRVENVSEQPVTVSLLGLMRNPIAWGAGDRKLRNSISQSGETTFLTMRTEADTPCEATSGSLGLSVTGGERSWLSGMYSQFAQGSTFYESAYGAAHECFLHDFRSAGRLPDLDPGESPSHLLRLSDEEMDALSEPEMRRLLGALKAHAFVRHVYGRVIEAEPGALDSADGLSTFLKEVRARLDRLAGEDRTGQGWGDGALCSRVTLAPREQGEVRFTLAWHFPHHFSAGGADLGHMYEAWFRDAEDVSRFLVQNAAVHEERTVAFADTLFDTSLDPELADAWSAQLSTLAKSTWWTRDGSFGVWEGLGCCGLHTTDITYQGSFGLVALFPELQKAQMEMGARFQREDGRVHHLFIPDFSSVDDQYDRVDMNQQFVLLVARDYLWTGDTEYLRRLWPHVVKAMASTAALDEDGDGLPDRDTRRNTYDQWNFFGTPSYIGGLWLAALRAAVRLAEDLGEKRRAEEWREALRLAASSFEEKLWNGEYYSLWVDGETRDECCMTDQLSGEWFTSLVGLGHSLCRERVLAALQAIMKHNYTADGGLVNASYPPGKQRRLPAYRNYQVTAPWTGIEYAAAAMMLDFGLVEEARLVVRAVHERYLHAGRFWNHVECGNHYYRAMSSWALLLAATGFRLDVPRETLTIAPRIPEAEVRAPWASCTGWGSFTRNDGSLALSCGAGEVRFRTLRIDLSPEGLAASLNGAELPMSVSTDAGATVVAFAQPVVLRAGESLLVARR